MFIDKLEIEEMLGEYYDFSEFGEGDWEKANKEIERICDERGIYLSHNIHEDELDEFYAICDGVIGKIVKGIL